MIHCPHCNGELKERKEKNDSTGEKVYDCQFCCKNWSEFELNKVEEIVPGKTLPAGTKFDSDKLEMHLLPIKPLKEIVKVLMFGKKKYGEENWKKLENAKIRYINAARRHLDSHMEAEVEHNESEKFDYETGLYHLAHCACCIIFVLWFEMTEHKNR